MGQCGDCLIVGLLRLGSEVIGLWKGRKKAPGLSLSIGEPACRFLRLAESWAGESLPVGIVTVAFDLGYG